MIKAPSAHLENATSATIRANILIYFTRLRLYFLVYSLNNVYSASKLFRDNVTQRSPNVTQKYNSKVQQPPTVQNNAGIN